MKKTLDLKNEKINKLLIAFSIPCIISMLINSVYNIVDQIFIGQGVGFVGNAATNVIFPLVILSNAVAGLFGNGCAANLSLRLGEGKHKEASAAVAVTITFSILISIIFGIILYLLLPNLINFFGCTENVYPYALEYGKIIVIGLPFMIIYTTLSSIIRADGSPKYSMIVLVTGAIINIILDYIFIIKLGMGVKGGALATIIGQIVSCFMSILYLAKFKSIKVKLSDYKLNSSIFKIMGMGLSSFITQATILVLFVFMNNIMTKYGVKSKFGGDIPLSVYGVISKLNSLYVSAVLGISIGAQPIIGYNYGAGCFDRVRETLKKVVTINFIIGIIFNLSIFIFAKEIVGVFGSADNTLYMEFAVDFCHIFLSICTLNAFEMTSSIVIQSLGNVKKATAVSFIRQIILFIPISLILTHFIGLYGALYAAPVADFICFICVIFIFKSEYKKVLNKTLNKEVEDIKIQEINKDSDIVITINREYGSGGRYVGRLLAEELNIPFYDKEIISLSAKESGFTEEFIEAKEQQRKNTLIMDYNTEDEIFIAEAKVIRKLANNSCVIVGRCADDILKSKKNVVRIFLYSTLDKKIERITKYYGKTKKEAKKALEDIDKQREKHYKHYTNNEWHDLSHYDLSINVDLLGINGTKDIICSFLNKI